MTVVIKTMTTTSKRVKTASNQQRHQRSERNVGVQTNYQKPKMQTKTTSKSKRRRVVNSTGDLDESDEEYEGGENSNEEEGEEESSD